MDIKNLLTEPHFIISEYLGEFIVEEEDYKSIRKGTLLELDKNASQDIFIQTIPLFIEEWASVIDLFEEFVDEFNAKAHTSCWTHPRNLRKINQEGSHFIELSKRYLTTHSVDKYQHLNIKQLFKTYHAAYDKFNDVIDRFNQYLTAYSNIQKMANIAKNVDIKEIKCTTEYFKPLAVGMNELTNIIDEHNISKFDNELLKEYYDTCVLSITVATEIIDMIENEGFEDDINLLDSLKTSSAKSKLMAFQLRQYMCQG